MDLTNFFNQVQTQQETKAKGFTKRVHMEYLTNGDTYVRVLPYKDETNTDQLYRVFSYHSIPMNVKVKQDDGTEEYQIKTKQVPCEGKNCPYCKIAYQLKDAGVKDSFKYLKNTNYLAQGVILEKRAGVGYVPTTPFRDENGTPKLGILVFNGQKKHTRGIDNFLTPSELLNLEDENPAFTGMGPLQAINKIFAKDTGNVLRLSNKKDHNGHWQAVIKVLPAEFSMPESSINVDKDVLSTFSDEFKADALASLKKVAEGLLAYKGETLAEVPVMESPIKIQKEEKLPFIDNSLASQMAEEAMDIFGNIN